MYLNSVIIECVADMIDILIQLQINLVYVHVERPSIQETTALGSAYLAGLAVGFWEDQTEIAKQWKNERTFVNELDHAKRDELYAGWKKAVESTRTFK